MSEPESVELTIDQILDCLDASTAEELLEILEEFFGQRRVHAVTWNCRGRGVEFTTHLTRNLLPQLTVDELRRRNLRIYRTPAEATREFAAIYQERTGRNFHKGVLQLFVER